MCRLKSNVLLMFSCCFLVLTSDSFSEDIQDYEDEDFSRRMIVHEALDGCIDMLYKIRSGELSQEDGLDQVEETLDFIKFMCWYWIED